VPKIIEIGKYLFKLQLKMSGVFFWDTLYIPILIKIGPEMGALSWTQA